MGKKESSGAARQQNTRRFPGWHRAVAGLVGVVLALVLAVPLTRADTPIVPTPINPNSKAYSRYLVDLWLKDVIGFNTLKSLWRGNALPSSVNEADKRLLEAYYLFRGAPPGQINSMSHPGAVTGSYSLSSATPFMPFVGNQLVVEGLAPFGDGSNAAAVGFRSSGDCTLYMDFAEPVNNLLVPTSVFEIPAAQDYLHTLAGLATTPDVFPHGCLSPSTGRASVFTAQVVTVTASGVSLVADLNSGTGILEVQKVDSQGVQTTVTLGQAEANGLLTVDLNGDGNDDLVTSGTTDPATSQKAFAVYISNGDGTFQAARYVDADVARFLIADVNGDGKLDLVGSVFAGGVITALGVGDGTFHAAAASATSMSAVGNAFVAGDFDADGKTDLLIGTTILKGAGDGSFAAGPVLAANVVQDLSFAYYAAVGDVNNDGKLDIAYHNSAANVVQVLMGNGDGTFTLGSRYASFPAGQQVTITDIDGDGNPDIVVGGSDKGVFGFNQDDNLLPAQQFLMGRGDGSFVGAPVYASGAAGSVSLLTGVNVQPWPVSGGADYTGDGKIDLLSFSDNVNGGQAGAVVVTPGDGTGQLGAAISSPVRLNATAIAAGDFNGDGKADVVLVGAATSGSTPQLSILLGQGGGQFAAEQDTALANIPASIAVGDFNGDGHLDVAVGVQPALGTSGDSGVYILFGKGDGTFAAPVKIDVSLAPDSLAASDLNGDGRADLVIADQGRPSSGGAAPTGALRVYLGNADGSFTQAAAPTAGASSYSMVRLGDLNGDGKADLIVGGFVAGASIGTGTPNVYTFTGTGDGTFAAPKTTALSGTDGVGALSMTLADFNGDGHLDVAVTTQNDYTEVLFGAGDVTLGDGLLALGEGASAVGSLDLNGDGMPELLVTTGSGFAVFLNAPKTKWPTAAATVAATTTVLNAAPSAPTVGASVTLTAAVTSGVAGAPTGSVQFFDGATALGTGSVTQGSATFTTSALSVGSHTVSAQYSGDTAYGASTSAAITLVVGAAATPDFAISVSPTAASVAAGQAATATLTLTPSGGFSGAVALTCSGAPSGATCSVAPASVTLSGAVATATLTVSSTARTAAIASPPNVDPFAPNAPILALFAVPLLSLRAGRRGRRSRARSVARALRWLVLPLACSGLLAACHHDHTASAPPAGGTPAGSYTVTVNASGGSVAHAASYALTIT